MHKRFKSELSSIQLNVYSLCFELNQALRRVHILTPCLYLKKILWKHIPYRYFYKLSACSFRSHFWYLNDRLRCLDKITISNKSLAINSASLPEAFIHRKLWQEKKILDRCIYFNNRQLDIELSSAASHLQASINDILSSGNTVILAPLHMVSDVAVGVFLSYLGAESVSIISNHDFESIGPNEKSILNEKKINLINPSSIGGGALKNIIKNIKNNKILFAIYPDAPPEMTWRLSQKSMRTFDCKIFSRKARLHSGLADLAKITKSTVLFFCLVDNGHSLNVDIIGSLTWDNIMRLSPELIEKTIRNHSDSWLLWHTPSLFYFNSADKIS